MQKILIGKREVVGFGTAGEATYMDLVMNPFPAIRFVAIYAILVNCSLPMLSKMYTYHHDRRESHQGGIML